MIRRFAQLNRDWRGVDAATNVLSFPTKNAGAPAISATSSLPSKPSRARPAPNDKPLAHHLAHLAVHGFLHLVGYDHERPKDALEMERAEREILRQLAIPDPIGQAGQDQLGKTYSSETLQAWR